MIDLAEIISRTRTRYDHATTTRWSDAEVALSISEGLETLAEETGFYERYTTLPVDKDRTYYDIRGFTPEIPLRIKSIWSTSRNQWLAPIVPNDLQFRWQDSRGEPEMFFTRGIYFIGLWPSGDSDATSGFLRVYFNAVPARWLHTQEVLSDLPKDYIPALIDYALYDLCSKDREPSKAIRHYKNYLRRENDLKNRLDRRGTAGDVHAMGGMAGLLPGEYDGNNTIPV